MKHFSFNQSFIKSILVVVLTVCSLQMWGTDITTSWTASSGGLGSGIGSGTFNTSVSGTTTTHSWNYTRTLSSGTSYTGWTSNCIQLGKNGGIEHLTLSTSNIPGTIKSVSIECASHGGNHNVSITVGSSTYLASTGTPSWTTVDTRSGTGTSSGTITISFTGGSRALYIKSITVVYNNDGGGTPTLSSIAVKTPPTKTSYTAGEFFDPTGLVITRTYSDASTSDYTYADHTSEFSFLPSLSTALTTSNVSVSITYSGKSTSQAITVASGGGGSCSVFHETWDDCSGTGGNDDVWSGSIATSTVSADNSGWAYSTSKGGGNSCLKVGAGSTAGYATSPDITVSNGTAYTLNVKAAPWGTESCTLTIELTGAKFSDNSTSKTTDEMSTQTWNSFPLEIIATSTSMTVDISASQNRFFIDEVCIGTSGPTISTTASFSAFTYNLNEGPSASQTFTVSGSSLTGDLTITAPANYQVSLDGSSWANTQTLTATAGTVSSTSVYVRLIAGLSVNTYNGDITISGGGATSKNVTVNGEVVLDCSTPTIEFDDATVTKYKGDAKFTITPNVTGNILEAAVTYASSNTECATVDVNTGEVTILKATATGTPVRITATLAEKSTSTSCTNEVSAYYDLTIYNRVTWYVNDAPYTTGDPTPYVAQNKPVTTLPTAPDGSSMCGGKTFVGWTDAPYAESDDAPAHLYKAANNFPNLTDNASYYAVFAQSSGSGGTPSSESYSFTDKYWHASEGNWTSGQDGAGYSNSGVQVTTGASGANATCPESYSNITSIVVSYCTNGSSGAGSITMEVDGTSLTNTITKTGGTTARNTTFDFSSTTPTGSPHITVTCTTNSIYVCGVTINYGGGTTYSGYTTTCGAGISAPNIGWITTSAGQKVKRVVNVSATNFDDPTTLSVSCDNSHFNVSLAATDVPAGAAGLTTTLTVEYTPTAQGREENVEIVLTAGDKSRTITVNGRCVPDEFLLITKKSSKWYALPANMSGGPAEYDGIEVSPNDATTPTVVPVSPTTTIYSMVSVANSRYADNGNCVRLVGNGNLCLWSNLASTTGKTNIQNKTSVATAATDNHDWLLTTTDGIRYTIANPHHPHYGTGRHLAYGTKFGMYDEDTEFFIVSAGCSSQPGEVAVSPRRVEATFSWVSNAGSMTIDLYTNELMTEGHLTASASSSPYVFSGLEESKPYWYRLTPGTDIDCAVTGTFITTGPIIDIVEWEENGVVLFIDKGDINPKIVIDGQEEHGSITGGGGNATELFFAKYFEGAGSMKLLSIFNGTNDAITLSGYKFVDRHAGSGASSFGSDVEYDLTSLGSINAGQEIIFFTRPKSTEVELSGCSTDFLNSVATKDKPTDNPRWIECASGKFADKAIEFNGNDAILLKKNGTIIDVIGALNKPGKGSNCSGEDAWEGTIKNMDKGKSPSDPVFDAFYETSSKSPVTKADSIALLAGFGINLSADEIDISTARCIFFRDKRVTSGDSAVLMNAGDNFVTFTTHGAFISEWYGRSVCMTAAMKTAAGVTNDAQATCNSYQDIANMDYNEYYIDWHNIDPGTELSNFIVDPETKEYTIPIADMRQYACLSLRFQLVHEGNVLTDASQQVPIVVTGDVDTNDPLFSELVIDQSTHLPSYSHSLARCADCNVVVLGSATLTKGVDTDPKDVPEVGNVKVYPGGKLIVPSGTTYRMKSLAFRRQEDEVAGADVQGAITFTAPAASPAPARRDNGEKQIRKAATGKKNTYFDLRVDPTNWHYFTLPYDCNVADIRYANPEETAVPVLGTDYLIKWYNGERRAATQAGGCWEMVAADGTLKAGLGYIFSIPGDGSVRREFRFPMDNEVIEQEKADKMAAPVYGYGCDKSMTEVRANHRGWNLLGNPYLMPYTTDISTPLETGLIVEDHSTDPWDGHYKFDENSRTNNLRYIVEPINNGWAGYRQVSIQDYPMTPFTCYFVQVGGTDPEAEQGIDFHVARVNRSASPIRRAPAEYEEVEDTHPVWCAVTLTNPNGEKDETTMLISNDFTDEYDMMNDLVKMRGTYYQYAQITTKPVLASRNNEGEMAFNALPDSSALAGIPLNYFAASQGSYTIAYNDKYDKDREVKEVKLWDKTTNQWYNLMDEPYTFNTARTDNKDRFVLSVRVERKQNQVTTSIEDLNSYSGDKPRKLLINGHVYIQRGKDIYDVTGKQVENF